MLFFTSPSIPKCPATFHLKPAGRFILRFPSVWPSVTADPSLVKMAELCCTTVTLAEWPGDLKKKADVSINFCQNVITLGTGRQMVWGGRQNQMHGVKIYNHKEILNNQVEEPITAVKKTLLDCLWFWFQMDPWNSVSGAQSRNSGGCTKDIIMSTFSQTNSKTHDELWISSLTINTWCFHYVEDWMYAPHD